MPLYILAGSIISMGPVVQYTDEKLDAEWTIQIYPGVDGHFTVYEDSDEEEDSIIKMVFSGKDIEVKCLPLKK